MSKEKSDRSDPYIKLEHYMMDSAAWTSLTDRAVWLYLELRRQFNFSKGGDNYLVLPFSKVKWRMSRGSFSKGMKELERLGFIRCMQRGGLFRRPSVYAVCNDWQQVSREIVGKEGREAIRLGYAKKPSSRNNLINLEGKRTWEKGVVEFPVNSQVKSPRKQREENAHTLDIYKKASIQ